MKIIDEGTAEIVMHPVRFRILKCLTESEAPLYIGQIAEAVNEHPRLVSHHIGVLEDEGLVESRYELLQQNGGKRGVAVRLCSPTAKLHEVLKEIGVAVTTEVRPRRS